MLGAIRREGGDGTERRILANADSGFISLPYA
jgi:hypothetical protein